MPESRLPRSLRRFRPSWRHRDGDSVLARRLDHRLDRMASGTVTPVDLADRSAGDESELGELSGTVAEVFALDSRRAPVSSPRAQTDKAGVWNSVVRNAGQAETSVSYRPVTRSERAMVAPWRRRFAPALGACLAALLLLGALSPLRHAGWDLVFPPERPALTPEPVQLPAPAPVPALGNDRAAEPTACDRSASIPIFHGLDTSPLDRTSLLVRPDGELVLTCPEAPTPRALASGVLSASPTGWPAVIRIEQMSDGSRPDSSTLIDIATGNSVVIGPDLAPGVDEVHRNGPSPWVVARASGDSYDWMIVDLRTMAARPLSDYASGPLPAGIEVATTSNGSAGTIAIDLRPSQGGIAPSAGQSLPGDALFIEDSFDAFHWLSFPEDVGSSRTMTMAPDGNHLAVEVHDAGDLVTYYILWTSDGAETARSASFADPGSSLTWLEGGDTIVYTQESSLMALSTRPESEPVQLFKDFQPIGRLRLSYDPATVLFERTAEPDIFPISNDMNYLPQIYSFNVETERVVQIFGTDISYDPAASSTFPRFLVVHVEQHPSVPLHYYEIMDAATGVKGGQISDIPSAGNVGIPPNLSIAATRNGETMVVGFDPRNWYLIRAAGSGVDIQRIASPEFRTAGSDPGMRLVLSPDGTMLSARRDGPESQLLMLDTDPSGGEWVEVSATADAPPEPIPFVPGIAD